MMLQKDYENSTLFKRVCYASRKPTKIEDLDGNSIDVYPTFAFNDVSKTARSTAERWANSNDITTFNNEPFRVKLINLDVRSEGGRAYKVIDESSRLFDLREDQLLAAIRVGGINRGGTLNCYVIWGSLSSQTRLVVVGSTLHEKMIENDAKRAAFSSQSILWNPSPGDIGRDKFDVEFIFMGQALYDGKTFNAYVTNVAKPLDFFATYDQNRSYAYQDAVYRNYCENQKKLLLGWDRLTDIEKLNLAWYSDETYNRTPDIVLYTGHMKLTPTGVNKLDVVRFIKDKNANHHCIKTNKIQNIGIYEFNKTFTCDRCKKIGERYYCHICNNSLLKLKRSRFEINNLALNVVKWKEI